MSIETSKKILKIFGIISIVFGILGLIAGIAGLAGGGILASATDDADAAVVGVAAAGAGIVILISSLIMLIEGIFSFRASKDSAKIMPAWVFALIGLIFAVIGVFTNIGNGGSAISSSIVSVAINALIFVAANTIKKSR